MTFRPKVAVIGPSGNHVRSVPGALAGVLVRTGIATAKSSQSVALTQTAATHATRIGPPSDPSLGVRFTRWARLDESAARVIEHHPRCGWIY